MLPLLLARVGAGGLEPPALAFLPAVGATCCMGSYSALGAAAAPSLVAVAPAPAARGRPPRIISAIIVAILSRRAVAVPRMPFDPTPRRNRHNGRENDAERSICLMRSRSGRAAERRKSRSFAPAAASHGGEMAGTRDGLPIAAAANSTPVES
jgi:hypothetical protein